MHHDPMRLRLLVPIAVSGVALVGAVPADGAALVVTSVPASAETTRVEHAGDAADDPAIWVHPAVAEDSLIIGTDKKGALEVYSLSGARRQRFPADAGNNVDVQGDLVVSTEPAARRLHVYRVNPATRRLEIVGDVTTATKGRGVCLFGSPSGAVHAFTASAGGVVVQYELTVSASSVAAVQRRRFDVGSSTEGCAVDDRRSRLYVSEENLGAVWRYDAAASGGTARVLVDSRASSGRYSDDAEGIAVVGDLLIVSSQGDSWFEAYDRVTNLHLGHFRVTAGATADACSGTDGIAASPRSLGIQFPDGLFVCQDHQNTQPGSSGRQDFKLVDLGPILAAFG